MFTRCYSSLKKGSGLHCKAGLTDVRGSGVGAQGAGGLHAPGREQALEAGGDSSATAIW